MSVKTTMTTQPTTPQAQVTEEMVEPERENLGNKIGWVCFHCWEFFPPTFAGQRDAQAHFGGAELREPACLISKKDHGLLLYVRALELERDELKQQLAVLSTPPARQDVEALVEALEPFAALGGPNDGVMPAFHDLEDDVVIYSNSGKCITAGDVRTARKALKWLHAPRAAQPSPASRRRRDRAVKNFIEKHAAICSECKAVAQTSNRGAFIDSFFLPQMCNHCGSHMMSGRYNQKFPHWIHQHRIYKRVPAIRTANPFTWLRSDKWEIHEEHCYAA